MKKGIIYILLIAYTVLMIKPVLPAITDIIAHTLFYWEHAATVHIEKGKMHVHKELVEVSKHMADDNKPVNPKKDNQPTDHTIFFKNPPVNFTILTIYFSQAKSCSNLAGFVTNYYPPPRIKVI